VAALPSHERITDFGPKRVRHTERIEQARCHVGNERFSVYGPNKVTGPFEGLGRVSTLLAEMVAPENQTANCVPTQRLVSNARTD
jgi:hypothetical protein